MNPNFNQDEGNFSAQFGFGQGFFQVGMPQPGFQQQQFTGFGQPYNPSFMNQQPMVTKLKDDIFYPNGKKKYSSFHEDFFFESGEKVFDRFHNSAFYQNKQKAFDGFHGHVYYSNGKQAYDAFFYKAFYENGNNLGKSGVRYSAQNVSMNLTQDVDEFFLNLGQDFFVYVAISESQRTKKIKLYMGQQCVLEKTL